MLIGDKCRRIGRNPLDEGFEALDPIDPGEIRPARLLARSDHLAADPFDLEIALVVRTPPDAPLRPERDKPSNAELRAFLDGKVEARRLYDPYRDIDGRRLDRFRKRDHIENGFESPNARHARLVCPPMAVEELHDVPDTDARDSDAMVKLGTVEQNRAPPLGSRGNDKIPIAFATTGFSSRRPEAFP